MGNIETKNDYYWSYTDEPHATRRKEILAKYPQVRDLFGYDPQTKWVVLFWIAAQWFLAWHLKDYSWWAIVLVAYVFGGVAAQALFLAMHEISHNLLFEKGLYNRLFGCFANLSTAIPHFSMFVRYHMEHHKFQGVEGIDVDVPSKLEGLFVTHTFTKALWVFFQPLFYVIRPLLIKPKSPGFWEFINWTACVVADLLIFYYWGHKALIYLVLSSILGSGLHPIAGHFIAEHYVFVLGQETYSYYGPLNLITFNVGYHNEHHDFPRIPGSRLPQLKKIAPEYYDNLPSYTSWTKVIWDYIFDPRIGPFNRVMRKPPLKVEKDD